MIDASQKHQIGCVAIDFFLNLNAVTLAIALPLLLPVKL